MKEVKIFKNIKFICAVLCTTIIASGGYLLLNFENQQTYTYDELSSLSSSQLLDLFIENGLVINERLKQTFTEEELQNLFKLEFSLLSMGITSRSDLMYFDLSDKTKDVFDNITK